MSNEYKIINEALNNNIKDVLFPPELLDKLSEYERKIVERRIIYYAFLGVRSCCQYLKYLKMYDICEIFNDSRMQFVRTTDQVYIYIELYEHSKDIKYINKLLELSKTSSEAYSYLVYIYLMGYDLDKTMLYQELEKLSTQSSEYKELFEKNCKYIPEEIKNIIEEIKHTK